MRLISFDPDAFDQFTHWAGENKKLFGRLQRPISETAKDPFSGVGKPEPLRAELRGYWSRRINEEHRLVYKVTSDQIIIVSCRYHY